MLVTSRTELLFLEWFSDPVSVGLFGLAFGLAMHLFAPAQAFVGPLVPALSGLVEVDPTAVERAYLRVLRCSSTIGGMFTASAIPAFAALVPVLYGEEYAAAADLVLALGAVAAIGILNGPLTAFVMARLGGGRMLRIDLTALGINLLAAVLLIPTFGAWGAVLASALGTCVRCTLLLLGESLHLAVSRRASLKSVAPVLVSVLVAITVWTATTPLTHAAVVRGLVAAGLGALAFFLLLRLLRIGISAQDRTALANVAPAQLRPAARAVLGLVATAR